MRHFHDRRDVRPDFCRGAYSTHVFLSPVFRIDGENETLLYMEEALVPE